MMFHVGQKVVCVDEFDFIEPDEVPPVKGHVYTIRGMTDKGEGLFIVLEEIVNLPRQYDEGFAEAEFDAECFRPVRTTSIEIFERMLTQLPNKETVS
jgi:hypothetical protein